MRDEVQQDRRDHLGDAARRAQPAGERAERRRRRRRRPRRDEGQQQRGRRARARRASRAAVAASAPARSWPSAPMFQTPQRKASATERPVSRSGPVLSSVAVQAGRAAEASPRARARERRATAGKPEAPRSARARQRAGRRRGGERPERAQRGSRPASPSRIAPIASRSAPGRHRHEPPADERQHAVGEREHLLELGRDQEDRAARRAQREQLLVHEARGADVETARRVHRDEDRAARPRARAPPRPSVRCRPRAAPTGRSGSGGTMPNASIAPRGVGDARPRDVVARAAGRSAGRRSSPSAPGSRRRSSRRRGPRARDRRRGARRRAARSARTPKRAVRPSTSRRPALGGRTPASTSSSSRCPLPSMPATPTISPRRHLELERRAARSPRAAPARESPRSARRTAARRPRGAPGARARRARARASAGRASRASVGARLDAPRRFARGAARSRGRRPRGSRRACAEMKTTAQPLAGEPPQHRKERARLAGRQRRGRLVEHQHARAAVEGAQDLGALALADRELLARRTPRGTSSPKRARSASARARAARGRSRRDRRPDRRSARFSSTLNAGTERRVLVHHADAGGARRPRAPAARGRRARRRARACRARAAPARRATSIERRLPGAVLAEQRVDLAGGDREVGARPAPAGPRSACSMPSRRSAAAASEVSPRRHLEIAPRHQLARADARLRARAAPGARPPARALRGPGSRRSATTPSFMPRRRGRASKRPSRTRRATSTKAPGQVEGRRGDHDVRRHRALVAVRAEGVDRLLRPCARSETAWNTPRPASFAWWIRKSAPSSRSASAASRAAAVSSKLPIQLSRTRASGRALLDARAEREEGALDRRQLDAADHADDAALRSCAPRAARRGRWPARARTPSARRSGARCCPRS